MIFLRTLPKQHAIAKQSAASATRLTAIPYSFLGCPEKAPPQRVCALLGEVEVGQPLSPYIGMGLAGFEERFNMLPFLSVFLNSSSDHLLEPHVRFQRLLIG